MTVPDRLREVIAARGLTIDGFATLLGEKLQRVKDVLRGKQRLPESMAAAMAREGFDVNYVLTGMPGERVVALESRMDALKETARIAGELTKDPLKGELVRDVLLGERWNKPEIVDAAIERYVAVRSAKP